MLLYPFLPFTSEKIAQWLDMTLLWNEREITVSTIPPEIPLLFARIDSCP